MSPTDLHRDTSDCPTWDDSFPPPPKVGRGDVFLLSVSKMSQKVVDVFRRYLETGWVCDEHQLIRFWWRSESENLNFFQKWFFTIEGLGQKRERARYYKMLWTSYDKTQWMILFGDKNKPFRFWFMLESRPELSWDTECKLFTLVEGCASPSAVRITFVSGDLAHRSNFREQYKLSWGTSNHETHIMTLNPDNTFVLRTDNTARSREMPASPDWTIRVTCCQHWRGASGKVLNSHFLTGETDDVTGMS